MKDKNKKIFLIASLIAVLVFGIGYSLYVSPSIRNSVLNAVGVIPTLEGDPITSDNYLVPSALVSGEQLAISDAEKEGLLKMREEEKLAHDVYTTLGDYWSQRVFMNISNSEQTHTDAVKFLLAQYGIDDPAQNSIGKFSDSELQALYTELVTLGKTSLVNGLIVGATVEDLDIFDLNNLLKSTSNPDIIRVYENLKRGSENHLRSFNKLITNNGGKYVPKYISDNEFQLIISNSMSGEYVARGKGARRGGRMQ